MAEISKLNLTGSDLDIKDAYMRSLVPSNADPTSNKLATIADISGDGGGLTMEQIWNNPNIYSGFSGKIATSKPISDYKFLIIRVKEGANYNRYSNGIVITDSTLNQYIQMYNVDNIYTRAFYISNNELYADNYASFRNIPNSNVGSSADFIIPITVYGIK